MWVLVHMWPYTYVQIHESHVLSAGGYRCHMCCYRYIDICALIGRRVTSAAGNSRIWYGENALTARSVGNSASHCLIRWESLTLGNTPAIDSLGLCLFCIHIYPSYMPFSKRNFVMQIVWKAVATMQKAAAETGWLQAGLRIMDEILRCAFSRIYKLSNPR